MNTYTINQFIVNIALLDEQVIYLKVIDNTSFSTYERNCEIRDFPNAESIEDTYKLITNCFDGAENHSCLFYAKVNMLQIAVNAKFGGYYTVKYDVYLKERISADQKCNAICARLVALETLYSERFGGESHETTPVIRESIMSLTDDVQLMGKEITANVLKYTMENNQMKAKINYLMNCIGHLINNQGKQRGGAIMQSFECWNEQNEQPL
jgi:hypothetical protein